eukprot:7909417-Alexandrium_andersonii.AAC.1
MVPRARSRMTFNLSKDLIEISKGALPGITWTYMHPRRPPITTGTSMRYKALITPLMPWKVMELWEKRI